MKECRGEGEDEWEKGWEARDEEQESQGVDGEWEKEKQSCPNTQNLRVFT